MADQNINAPSLGEGADNHADSIFDRFQARLTRLAASRLNPQPRKQSDEKATRESVLRRG